MKKNNIIISFLIAIVCIMAIGYAAFSSKLNILGISTIDSDWNVKIINVTVKNVFGNADKAIEPVYSSTSATFKTNLEKPGDSMTYEVTIANEGDIDAKVESIETTKSNNPAIVFSTEGIEENDLLESGSTQTYEVTIAYSDSVVTQPEVLSGTLTVKLNYVQNA